MAKTLVSLRLDPQTIARLDAEAQKQGISRTRLIEHAIALMLTGKSAHSPMASAFQPRPRERNTAGLARQAALNKPKGL